MTIKITKKQCYNVLKKVNPNNCWHIYLDLFLYELAGRKKIGYNTAQKIVDTAKANGMNPYPLMSDLPKVKRLFR